MADPLDYASPNRHKKLRIGDLVKHAALISSAASIASVPLTWLSGTYILHADPTKSVGMMILISPLFMAGAISLSAFMLLLIYRPVSQVRDCLTLTLAFLFFGFMAFWVCLFYLRYYF